MATTITGKQVRDNTITGDDVDEKTLVMPMVYHSSGNHNSTAVKYLALPGRNGWSGTFQKNEHQLVAPYNGKVTKVFLRPTTGDNLNNCQFQVRTKSDGNTIGTDPTITDNNITAEGNEATTETTFPTPVSITKGDAFGFSILKTDGASYGMTDAVIVIEWDLGS